MDCTNQSKKPNIMTELNVFVLHFQIHMVLPHRDRQGRRIVYFRPGLWDPSILSFNEAFGVGCMLGEMVALEPKSQVSKVLKFCFIKNCTF